jgi:hypothetical protein
VKRDEERLTIPTNDVDQTAAEIEGLKHAFGTQLFLFDSSQS